ncbi:YobA family protein [Fontibacillus sp. BL9]|uniref:YobA family protein n=1 Tax=Fontibacillus sp. BL9 TaxID=3389971 RepID=UPI00397C53F9
MYVKIMQMLLVLLLIGAGCSPLADQKPDGEGIVFEVSEGRVLILDNVDPEDIGKKSWNEIFETYQGSAIWLGTKNPDLQVGQQVRYWVEGGINDSFPSQASAKKIELIKK